MRRILILIALTTLVAVPGARANGSPYAPGLTQGLDGVLSTDRVTRFVTNASENWTIVTAIDDLTGRVLRTRTLPRFYGVPIVAYDGTTAGVSGDARSLVVAGYGPFPGEPGTTRFAVLNARTLGVRSLIALAGSWSYDAISPDGRTLYLVQHLSAGPKPLYRVRAFDVRRGRLHAVTDRRPARAGVRDGWAAGDAGDEPRRTLGLHALRARQGSSRSSTRSTRPDARRSASICPLQLAVGRQLAADGCSSGSSRLLVEDVTHGQRSRGSTRGRSACARL